MAGSGREAWKDTNTVFTNDKAGMQGCDKDKVKRIVYEMSKDSPHFKNEQKKQQQQEAKIARLKEQASKLNQHQLASHTRKMDAKIVSLLASRDLSRTWIHVDLDAFYASVEELENPELKSKPMGVGGIGMLATANYVARKFGVRSAMPGFIAKRLCPELVIVKPNFVKYTQASQEVQAVFREYDADMEAASLDEAYLDITDYCASHNVPGEQVAAEMRARVFEKTGLTCSCGVAPNRMLAKICSDINKPNGQCSIPADPHHIRTFVDGLATRKIPGIGKVGEQELKALGITTCSGLMEKRGLLSALYSEVAVEAFLAAGLGLGRTHHHEALQEGEVGRKGKSVERTFTPITDPKELEAKCCALASKLAGDLAKEGLQGKTLTLKLKHPTFELKTRAVTLGHFISTEQEIIDAALPLLRAELPLTVRLMGLRMSAFYQPPHSQPGQPMLAAFFKSKRSPEKSPAPAPGLDDQSHPPEEGSAPSREGEGEAPTSHTAREATDGEEPAKPAPTRASTGRQKKLWACQLCTFGENPHHSLRCLICDNVRGSLSVHQPQPEPAAAERPSEAQAHTLHSEHPRESRDNASEAAGADEGVCIKCGASIPEGGAQEHEDYHMALDLEGNPEGVSKQKPMKWEASKGKKRKPPPPPAITRFFKPARAGSA